MVRLQQFAILLVLSVVFAASAEAQTRLNFPRQLSVQELSTTGIALVNTSSASVAATFNFYGADGLLVAQSIQTVPAKGQLARLASEILPTAKASGWVQILSSSPELQGFELVGDFTKLVDGAGPAPEARQLALIDFSREDIIHVVNTGSQAGTVQVTLNNAVGETLGTRSIPLAPFQPASLRLGDVNEDNNIDLVSISADVTVSASVTTKLPGGLDVGMANATPVSAASSTLFIPFTPSGPQGDSRWSTFLGIANLASTSQTVSLTFTPDNNPPVTIERNLPAGASVGDTVANLFGTSSTTFTAGWIRVTGSGPLTGVAAYQDSSTGSLAVVPSQSSGAGAFFFGHIASLSPWYTGLALLNTTTTAANVELFAIDNSGQLVASAPSFSLAPGRRTALLSEFVPQVLQRASDGGWVFVRTTNNVPLLGFELFGHAVSPILANVQGFALPSTSTFAPPSAIPTPGGGSTGTVTVDRLSFTDGTTAKTQFKAKDAIAYVATIANSTGAPAPLKLTFTVYDPRNQPLFTTTREATVVATSADLSFLSYIPSNALNGRYTLAVSLASQEKTATKSATFDVTDGTLTPGVGQETPLVFSVWDRPQLAFRPGDVVQFVIPMANFTGQDVTATLNYQLQGPGPLPLGSTGTLAYSVPPGLSSKTIELATPNFARQFGLFTFTSKLTASGTTSTKETAITVVPRSAAETIEADLVFVSDSDGIPRGGFTPGSSLNLNIRTLSLFGVTVPATVRYLVTGPNSAVILDQSLAANVVNGGSVGSLPLTLSSNAAAGTYTFQVTVSYQDDSNATKTSTRSTTFIVGNSPEALTQTVTTQPSYVNDINLVTRTSFAPGEPLVLMRSQYSTYTASVAGTVTYKIRAFGYTLYERTVTTTFSPGLNTNFIIVSTDGTLLSGTYTFEVTSSTQKGQTTTMSRDFALWMGGDPRFGVQAIDGKSPAPGDFPFVLRVQEIPGGVQSWNWADSATPAP